MDPRLELVRYYRLLREHGYNDSHSGNLSLRLDELLWITPSGACADTLLAQDLRACPLSDGECAGASLDLPLHRAVYAANPAARVVMHSHGAYTVAMTLRGKDFVPLDFEGQLYFPRVPVLRIDYAEYVARSPALVADALSRARIVVVRGHGVYTCAQSLDLAYKWTCSLELSAKTAFIARQAGTA